MSSMRIIVGVVGALALPFMAGWQSAAWTLANAELRDDLHNMAFEPAARIGWVNFKTDDDFRDAVIRKAKEYDIYLEAEQITVRRSGTLKEPVIYLAADYKVPVRLPGYSFHLHFTASSVQ
jgi:hypothetical protein